MGKYPITSEDPTSIVACKLMDELSATLAAMTGDSGRSSFDPDDVRVPRALFVLARNEEGQAVGCGAFRPLQADIAEVKRMYSRPGSRRVGSAILAYLETEAAKMEYSVFWLETRLVNVRAVRFYARRSYSRIPNYGKYLGNPEAVCFEKRLRGL
ncbi:amino-acid N-acetyltransferase [Thermoflexales bacterium]|nr:amino-acid N-acetyltransferase [Thermoflexales bacterium]